ncbi:Hypothetical predicted protein [Lecanosticta acicola]|uniref:Uncharacterized protein n=1 Tax=Lecanosticta acicola TaxID=111012 RepID=A0AAI8Z1W8_9PEZI|nr:Hypothetical predicted protein [Lecanosticta acicola]
MASADQKGLLSPIGDPVGKVLDFGLGNTVGKVTSKVGDPPGEALTSAKKVGKNEVAYSEKDRPREELGGEPIGGQPQTAENPLGL